MKKIELLDHREIGFVDWFGGINTKTGKQNKFGFLNTFTQESVFVHKDSLLFALSKMEKGACVTFRREKTVKGVSAVDVQLAEDEKDLSVIKELLEIEYLNEKVRFEICYGLIDDQRDLSVLKLPLKQTMSSIYPFALDEEDLKKWHAVTPASSIFEYLPDWLQDEWFQNNYQQISNALSLLNNDVDQIKISTSIYARLSNDDKSLASLWLSSDSDFEKAKMLSARGAELAIMDFFSSLGRKVTDTAIHQITGESDHWRDYDLNLDDHIPIDVKNARLSVNSSSFVEFIVKKFKSDKEGNAVVYSGVLSPYCSLEKLQSTNNYYNDFIYVLGVTRHNRIVLLESEFSNETLKVSFGEPDRWPIWIFDNDRKLFSEQSMALKELSSHVKEVKPDYWKFSPYNLLPICLWTGLEIPRFINDTLSPWQLEFYYSLLEVRDSKKFTLPWLYLFVFHHFLKTVSSSDSTQSSDYHPSWYYEILYCHDNYRARPLFLIDPLKIINQLIDSLIVLWNHKDQSRLKELTSFQFSGNGLLRATNRSGHKVTVLAYCGGFIDKKGKCGFSPLVMGYHQTCINCGMLICEKCGYCSDRCKSLKR